MANYGFLTRLIAIFSGKCHPSAWCVAVSSGKVVIYRISLMIRGCQKRRLDESSTSLVPVILHALYEMAHNLRGSRDQFFSRWTGHGESHHKWLEESYRLNDFCHRWWWRRKIRKGPFSFQRILFFHTASENKITLLIYLLPANSVWQHCTYCYIVIAPREA